jgi:hypothetical protein
MTGGEGDHMDWHAIGESVKGITEVVTAVVAVVALIVTAGTYFHNKKRDHDLAVKSERLKRFDKFQQMQSRYVADHAFVKVRKWIYREQHGQDQNIATPSEFEMHLFMAFFEEIAVMINSDLMSDDLAAYNIGIDAARFYDVVDAYHDDRYWVLFNSFAKKMKRRFDELTEIKINALAI